MRMKYIIICEDAIFMGGTFSHREVAQAILGQGANVKSEVKGAGFCSFQWNPDGGVYKEGRWEAQVFGKSDSLGIESKEGDKMYVEMAINS